MAHLSRSFPPVQFITAKGIWNVGEGGGGDKDREAFRYIGLMAESPLLLPDAIHREESESEGGSTETVGRGSLLLQQNERIALWQYPMINAGDVGDGQPCQYQGRVIGYLKCITGVPLQQDEWYGLVEGASTFTMNVRGLTVPPVFTIYRDPGRAALRAVVAYYEKNMKLGGHPADPAKSTGAGEVTVAEGVSLCDKAAVGDEADHSSDGDDGYDRLSQEEQSLVELGRDLRDRLRDGQRGRNSFRKQNVRKKTVRWADESAEDADKAEKNEPFVIKEARAVEKYEAYLEALAWERDAGAALKARRHHSCSRLSGRNKKLSSAHDEVGVADSSKKKSKRQREEDNPLLRVFRQIQSLLEEMQSAEDEANCASREKRVARDYHDLMMQSMVGGRVLSQD